MSEILFSCECGMTLKVGGDQAGEEITCPSCNATNRVPAVSKPQVAPSVILREREPDSKSAGLPVLGIAYLAFILLLTVGAVGFFLIPALSGPKDKVSDRNLASKSAKEDSPKKKKKGTQPRKTPRPAPERTTDDDDPKEAVEEVAPPPVEPAADLVAPPVQPPPPEESVKPKEDPVVPAKVPDPVKPAPPMPANSPYAHIKDPKVRDSLKYALSNAKFAALAGAALRFISQAEKLSNNDPEVLAETKKLRDMINKVRSRGP